MSSSVSATPAEGDVQQFTAPDAHNRKIVVGRSKDPGVVWISRNPSVSRQHAAIEMLQDGNLRIEDLQSTKGTYVNNVRVGKATLKPGDWVRFGENGPTFEWQQAEFVQVAVEPGMSLEVQGLGRKLPTNQWLIENLNFCIRPDTLTAIIGPSGSGKSTLIECLISLVPLEAGSIRFDEEHALPEDAEFYRRQIAYVPQDDLVYRLLSVEENLQFAAAIRLPQSTKQDRESRINSAISAMGLDRHKTTRAGKLSGGQRKRLSIAMELLRKPRLMVLDEPTSGLDLSLQAGVMAQLKKLAMRGTTILCTTHTLDTLHYADRVLAIGKSNDVGQLGFFGPPEQLRVHFKADNLAEIYPLLEHLEQGFDAPRQDAWEAGIDDAADPDRSPEALAWVAARQGRRRKPMQLESLPLRDAAGQGLAVFSRTLREFWRDWAGLLVLGLQPPLLALITVLSQHNQSGTAFIRFFLLVSAMWMGMSLAVRELVRERPAYLRDQLAGLNPWAYLAGKSLGCLMPGVVQTLLLGALGLLFVYCFVSEKRGITREELLIATGLVRTQVVLLLAGFGGLVIGLTISAAAKNERIAVALLPIVLLPQILLSRVSYGDGGAPWNDFESPYTPLYYLREYVQQSETAAGLTLAFGSLLLISRPLLVMIDYSHIFGATLLDAGWFLLLLLVHIALLCFVFHRYGTTGSVR